MTQETNPDIIRASATKDLFIFMLTKDIGIIDAIADLVDNSIDGARNLRGNGNYDGLFVAIEILDGQFTISDNCGGIKIEIARDYAFRFGRDRNAPETPHSIGRFGVGMKRSLFKLGNYFTIESTAENSKFLIEQNVEEWSNEENKWEFTFKRREEGLAAIGESERGTKITVTEIHLGIKDELIQDTFLTRLKLRLEAAHQKSIDYGLRISLNGLELNSSLPQILKSDNLVPGYEEGVSQDQSINYKIYVGLSEREPKKAGWNIYCNDRLILEADKSSITGWGKDFSNPEYHNDYSRFRGFVYFDSQHPNLLPWNTTKSSVDVDSRFYRATRQKMAELMRPAINFMSKVVAEKKQQKNDDPTFLEEVMRDASLCPLTEITQESAFSYPEQKKKKSSSSTVNISYSRTKEDVERIKRKLKVGTNREVGIKTFEYYIRMECSDV